MSDYIRHKEVAYPIDANDTYLMEKYISKLVKPYPVDVFDLGACEELKHLFVRGDIETNAFDVEGFLDYSGSGNVNYYLVYRLFDSYGEECGDFGRSRWLTDTEKVKYKKLFEQIMPIDANKLKYLDYCWYNCCECDDYYLNDDFEEEI